MAIDADAAFSVVQRALEDFDSSLQRVRAAHDESAESLLTVEYEVGQLRKMLAEIAPQPAEPIEHDRSAEHDGGLRGDTVVPFIQAA